MVQLSFALLLRMLVAHFLSDFIFQPTSLAKKKDKHSFNLGWFMLHIAITAITLFVILWDWHQWQVVLWVTLGHLIIDGIKSRMPDSNVWVFIVDQLLHLMVILFVWLVYTHQEQVFYDTLTNLMNQQKSCWLLLAYLVLSIPTSVLIGKMTQKWSDELEKPEKDTGLINAGKWIGIMERLLIFTFIVVNQLSAIGFVLAAKSVFRFGDLKNGTDQKKTEYIIIGTFLSFLIAIAIGLVYMNL